MSHAGSPSTGLVINQQGQKAINIGARRELFVDDFLIDRMTNVRRSLKHPEKRETFVFDAPWEDGSSFPYSVFTDPVQSNNGKQSTVRLYYRAGYHLGEESEKSMVMAMLQSNDGGVTFTRPALNLHELQGSKHNNIVSLTSPGVPPAFYDTNPKCDPAQRYKGLVSEAGNLFAMCSPDGLSWRLMSDSPLVYSGAFDTVNTAFWDSISNCYRSYTRVWVNKETENGAVRVRCIQSATSDDFINWSVPVENTYSDNFLDVQLYTNATIPCPGAEHIYLSFPNRYMHHRWVKRADASAPDTIGCNDGLFMSSRDGLKWNRYLEAWVRPGPDPRAWTQRCNYPTWGIVQTSATQWSMYVNEAYSQPDGTPGRLRRLSIRPHGFVSIKADYAGGEFTTKPLIFDGQCLRLNYATGAGGHIQVEIQDEHGKPIEGFKLNDMAPLFGDEIDGGVTWKATSNLASLIGRPVKLRFVMKDADIFALRFSSTDLDVNSGEVVKPSPPTYRTRALQSQVRVTRAATAPAIDGTGQDWDWSNAIKITAPDQYGDFCHAQVSLMYDDNALYVAARVTDPYPMINALDFKGDMTRSWTADALQIHLRAVTDNPPGKSDEDINDIRLWYSTQDGAAGSCIMLGKNIAFARVNPAAVTGQFERREDGKGYSLTYRLPWAAINSTRAPKSGERFTACLQCHWGTQDGKGLLCGAVEVRHDNAAEVYVAESWGEAVFE